MVKDHFANIRIRKFEFKAINNFQICLFLQYVTWADPILKKASKQTNKNSDTNKANKWTSQVVFYEV